MMLIFGLKNIKKNQNKMFSKGDSVKVNKGVSIPDLEEFDFTDWQGRIIKFIESDEVKGEIGRASCRERV